MRASPHFSGLPDGILATQPPMLTWPSSSWSPETWTGPEITPFERPPYAPAIRGFREYAMPVSYRPMNDPWQLPSESVI